MKIVVVISTYSPRRAWLRTLLNDLVLQTWLPESVIVLDDPPHTAPPPEITDDLAQSFSYEIRKNAARSGPAERWRFIARELPDDAIVVALDDDVRLFPHYIEQSVRWCVGAHAAVSWWPLPPEARERYEPVVEIPMLAGGLTTLRASWLRGIEQAPGAAEHLAFEKHDDVFLSWFLWWRGIPILRPTDWSDLLELRPPEGETRTEPLFGDAFPARVLPQVEALARTGWPWGALPRKVDACQAP